VDAISFRETRQQTFFVLVDSGQEFAGHAGVERPMPSARHHVDGDEKIETVSRDHFHTVFMGGRDKPGQDGILYSIISRRGRR
jgi:hypothetical protein